MYEPLESILAERARLMTALLARTPDERRRADIRQAFQEENEEIRAAYHAGTLHRQFHRTLIKVPSRPR